MTLRFTLCALIFLAACASDPVVQAPVTPVYYQSEIGQDWREATDCILREMDKADLKNWPLRASSQAGSFDFKNEVSTIMIRQTDDMAALYSATIQKTGDNHARLTVTPVVRTMSSYTDLVGTNIKKAAATCA